MGIAYAKLVENVAIKCKINREIRAFARLNAAWYIHSKIHTQLTHTLGESTHTHTCICTHSYHHHTNVTADLCKCFAANATQNCMEIKLWKNASNCDAQNKTKQNRVREAKQNKTEQSKTKLWKLILPTITTTTTTRTTKMFRRAIKRNYFWQHQIVCMRTMKDMMKL